MYVYCFNGLPGLRFVGPFRNIHEAETWKDSHRVYQRPHAVLVRLEEPNYYSPSPDNSSILAARSNEDE